MRRENYSLYFCILTIFFCLGGFFSVVSAASSEEYVFEQAWGLHHPQGITVDSSGVIYAVESDADRIKIYSSEGVVLGSISAPFSLPRDVAVDNEGNIFVSDTWKHCIFKFSPDGNLITQWGSKGSGEGKFDHPYGVGIDAFGNVYVADTYNNRIQKFNSDGTFIAKWGTKGSADGQFSYPFDIAVSGSGDMYISEFYGNRIQKLSSDGTFIAKWGVNRFPQGICLDSEDNVYVTDYSNSQVKKFTSTGTLVSQWGSEGTAISEFDRPWGVVVDSSGYVYVCDAFNNRIQKFAPASALLSAEFIYDVESGSEPLAVHFTDQSLGNPVTWEWDFGDGQTGSGESTGHIYEDNGEYLVTLTVTNPNGKSDSTTATIVVSNVAPTITPIADQAISEGSDLTLSVPFIDPGILDTHTAVINWGDGSETQTISINPSTYTLSASHQYEDDGEYLVGITVTDNDGDSAETSFIVTVENVVPSVDAGEDGILNEGDSFTFTGTFDDPGVLDTHTIVWTFEDSETVADTLNPVRTYADNGEYSVLLTVTDDDGGVGEDSVTITVENVAPIVDSGLDREVFAGDSVEFSGSFTDPGVEDTHSVTWNFGDGESENILEPTHVYTNAGVYSVTLTVTDDDGGIGQDTMLVTVKPVAATVNINPDSLNLGSNGVITAFISLPEKYDGTGIDPATVTCEGFPAIKGMICDEYQYDYQVKFDRNNFANLSVGDDIPLSVKGKFNFNGYSVDFEGTDTIAIMKNGNGKKNH